jgi:hypothetical protein
VRVSDNLLWNHTFTVTVTNDSVFATLEPTIAALVEARATAIVQETRSALQATTVAQVETPEIIELTAIVVGLTATRYVLDLSATSNMITNTPTTTPTRTATPTPTEDLSITLTEAFEATVIAANNHATETAIAATQTLGAQLNPPEMMTGTAAALTPLGAGTEVRNLGGGTSQPVEIGAVQMTATALANMLVRPTATGIAGGSGGATPTIKITDVGSTNGGNALPDTGLFDDVLGGNPLAILAVACGLLGIIIAARYLRSANRKCK